jgi:hypothetical protein
MVVQIIASVAATPTLLERLLLTFLIIVHHLVHNVLLGLLIHRLVVCYLLDLAEFIVERFLGL